MRSQRKAGVARSPEDYSRELLLLEGESVDPKSLVVDLIANVEI